MSVGDRVTYNAPKPYLDPPIDGTIVVINEGESETPTTYDVSFDTGGGVRALAEWLTAIV